MTKTKNNDEFAKTNLRWAQVPTVHGKSNSIPSESGIYAYGEVRRVGGLPVEISWVYIGKSKNLKTRIGSGHDSSRESNQELKRWMKRGKESVELWFALVPEAALHTVESHLIATINPTFNVNLKKK